MYYNQWSYFWVFLDQWKIFWRYKIRTNSQPLQKSFKKSIQSNCTLTTFNSIVLLLIPLDRTEGKLVCIGV